MYIYIYIYIYMHATSLPAHYAIHLADMSSVATQLLAPSFKMDCNPLSVPSSNAYGILQ